MNLMIPTDQIGAVDSEVIKELVVSLKPKIVVEVGCWVGQVSEIFMKGSECRLMVIDTFGGQGSYLEEWVEDNRFDVLGTFKQNMALYMPRIDISVGTVDGHAWKVGEVDFVFIDGDHRYSAVSRDIKLLWDKVREGGVMAGHDFDRYVYDNEFIELDYAMGNHHGVSKAVQEKFPYFNVKGRVWWVEKNSV